MSVHARLTDKADFNYRGFLPRRGHECAEQMKEAAAEMERLRQDLVALHCPAVTEGQLRIPSRRTRGLEIPISRWRFRFAILGYFGFRKNGFA